MARRKKGRDISGWLVVDKPAGLTSTAVVNKVRWAFDAKKAGHAGTLDPDATGVLAVALGEATKTVPYITDALKAYEFTVRFGQATRTDDAEGEVIWSHQTAGPSKGHAGHHDVQLLASGRHSRKLRRGVHRANRFSLRLRGISGERAALEERLLQVAQQGVPNYFGEQRFGRGGATLEQARRWALGGSRRLTRAKRGLYLSALRSLLFNTALAARVKAGNWNSICNGDVCMLRGSRSLFTCELVDDEIRERAGNGDIHPGLPLWGSGACAASPERARQLRETLAEQRAVCEFLEQQGLELAWRPARLMADDFCWQFCDDDSLQLEFRLGAGSFATALLAEFARYA